MAQQPGPYSVTNPTGDPVVVANAKAALRRTLITACAAGAAGANNAGAALYTAAQLATYSIACADAIIAALVLEGP